MGEIQYEIISVIKQSNKGSVYLAKVEGYAFPVIVKQLKRGNRKVFEALQALGNEHVPQIYQLEENADGILVVEEYIEGETMDFSVILPIAISEKNEECKKSILLKVIKYINNQL